MFAEALDLVDDAPEWRAANPLPVGRSALAEWVESDSGDGPGRLSRELPAATTHADAHVGIALHRAFSGSGGELWVLGMCRPQLAALTYADLEQMTYAQMEDMAFYVFDEPYVWLRGTHGRDVLDEVDRVTRWYRATLLGKRFAGRPRGKGEFADVAAFLTDLKVALDAHGRELTQGEFADTRGTTARTVREWTRRARESHGDCLAFVNFPELVHALRGISAEELRSRIH
ncbi:hypothetical protein CMK11_05875 [Candidatus Poribacteria bacterium]|nr:hypothetical protein [Candidatus Poribacteria bacterium]